jgi:hypothetical protein
MYSLMDGFSWESRCYRIHNLADHLPVIQFVVTAVMQKHDTELSARFKLRRRNVSRDASAVSQQHVLIVPARFETYSVTLH